MTLDLPAPRRGHLRHAPLALVVCQVRFEQQGTSFPPAQMFAIHEALGGAGGLYPKREDLQSGGVSLQVGPNGLMTGETPMLSGYRLQSAASDWLVSLMPDHVGLETTSYVTWNGRDNFADVERPVGGRHHGHRPPGGGTRGIALRGPDHATGCHASRRPAGLPGSQLLGIALHHAIGPGVLSSQQQVDIECDADARCTLRHGYAADPTRNNALTYVLDWDMYRTGIRPFDVSGIRAALDRFNDLASRLFQAVVTPAMMDVMIGEGD